jgi:hypothetical protein
MIVTTGNEVEMGKIVQYLGVVRGIVVRSPSIGQGIVGGLKSIIGGNIEAYSQVCEAARLEAFNRMLKQAHEIGAMPSSECATTRPNSASRQPKFWLTARRSSWRTGKVKSEK